MSITYYILPKERKRMQEEAVKRAMVSIGGPVGFYEHWPGEESRLTVTEEALQAWRSFCKMIWPSVMYPVKSGTGWVISPPGMVNMGISVKDPLFPAILPARSYRVAKSL